MRGRVRGRERGEEAEDEGWGDEGNVTGAGNNLWLRLPDDQHNQRFAKTICQDYLPRQAQDIRHGKLQ